MSMTTLYVSDTVGLIHYFSDVFNQPSALSSAVRAIYDEAFLTHTSNVRLSIPGIVFVEIHEKWCVDEEFARKFHYEVFSRVLQSPNVEVRAIDRETLECMERIGRNLADHEIHDKLIVASAMILQCPLITCDSDIVTFNTEHCVIPRILF